MRHLRKLPLALVVLATIACEAPEPSADQAAPAPQTSATDEAAVRSALAARLDTYQGAALAGDVETMKSLWTDDVHMLQPGMNLSGAEVMAFYDETFGGGAQVQSMDIRIGEVFAHGDAAYTIGDYDETLTMTPDGAPHSLHENWFARWERGADGTWRIDRIVTGTVDAPEEM